MARVTLLIPDLLFGSRVQAMLAQAGHEVTMPGGPAAPDAVRASAPQVVVVDLVADTPDGVSLVQELRAAGAVGDARVLGFFAHTEPHVHERALAAGFDQVVPRSRMNREGAELVAALAA